MVVDNGSSEHRFASPDVDVVVAGAGFAGLYLLHRLRGMGMTARVFETADDVGGTWYWNRYPGARCDIQTVDYSYSFDPDLETEWQWSEKYARQAEILRYLQFVTDKYDLRGAITFSTRIERAVWDEDATLWRLHTDQGDEVSCRYYVMATGCLSAPKRLDIEGVDDFAGDIYHTSSWPHDDVDFSGKRVAVIGTGSSGVQSTPIIAGQAAELTVFQRTPNFSMPAHNGALPAKKLAAFQGRCQEYREEARWSRSGVPFEAPESGALQVSAEEREARYEAVWQYGDLIETYNVFNDLIINQTSNETLAEFVRNKIRSTVKDPATAEALCPTGYPWGTKRPCLDTNYFETYNLPHVKLVDLLINPIRSITETGIETTSGTFEFDAIVFATGFDAMTGAIVAVDIRGRDGIQLKDKWSDGPTTYLGLTMTGFPNLFVITGPGSPSVMSNMVVAIEQHVEWVSDCVSHMKEQGLARIEPTELAETAWVQHVNDFADLTLYPQANSWYMGSNVPGKPRVFLPYIGGVDGYRAICNEVVSKDFLGFALEGPNQSRCNDGVIRPVKPDVAIMLDIIASLELPRMETMTADDARAFLLEMTAEQPPGPDVGEVVDGLFPGATGDLAYRLYRPASAGPHPMVAYFHGGGWVIGNLDTDDSFCRELCVNSNAIIVSFDYRHAPEARFPAAPDDGYAAVQWLTDNAEALGGKPGKLAVSGWSAGANIAAVVCQMARDADIPAIAGQLLITPVTDYDLTRTSYMENAEGYVLTAPLMQWFWDHYADPSERTNPKASPLLAKNLGDLPSALVVTAEFDPLRDEGQAYAEGMAAAGVTVRHLACRGQIHTSLTAVGAIASSVGARAEMGDSLRRFLV